MKQYLKKDGSIWKLRPYIKGEDMSDTLVSTGVTPEEDMGMMMVHQGKKWYLSTEEFNEYFEQTPIESIPTTTKRAFNTLELGTHYELPVYEVVNGKGIQETGAVLTLKFVRGSKLKDEDVEKREGTLHEHLLSVMIHDLKFKNGLVPSRESSLVITKLEEALMWLEERQKAREVAGVVGTYKPHK